MWCVSSDSWTEIAVTVKTSSTEAVRVPLESQRNAEAHAARLHFNDRQRLETWLKGGGVAVDFCAIKCHRHQRCTYIERNIPNVPLNVQGNARALYVIQVF